MVAVHCPQQLDQFHQYADDTQLHLEMRVDYTAAGLSIYM